MRLLVLLAVFFLKPTTFANQNQNQTCSGKSIEVTGLFGSHSVPLLDQWSETAGNFTKITFKGDQTFSKTQFIFKDRKGNVLYTKNFKLTNNESDNFDLKKLIKEAVIRPNSLIIKTWTKNGSLYCQEEMSIIEKDGQGGVLKQI